MAGIRYRAPRRHNDSGCHPCSPVLQPRVRENLAVEHGLRSPPLRVRPRGWRTFRLDPRSKSGAAVPSDCPGARIAPKTWRDRPATSDPPLKIPTSSFFRQRDAVEDDLPEIHAEQGCRIWTMGALLMPGPFGVLRLQPGNREVIRSGNRWSRQPQNRLTARLISSMLPVRFGVPHDGRYNSR